MNPGNQQLIFYLLIWALKLGPEASGRGGIWSF